MFGFRDEFVYMECSYCGCLQLLNAPQSMDKYYPSNYYSFKPVQVKSFSSVEMFWRRTKLYFHLKQKKRFQNSLLNWLGPIQLSVNSRILDVGCGTGEILVKMCEIGFKDLTGLDPHNSCQYNYENGVKIFNIKLEEFEHPAFDLIMLHHSFEHMSNPREILINLSRLLRPGGTILIRIPTTSSQAWRQYRTNWVQLDAPRHFFLHSLQSIAILLEIEGFEIKEIVSDSIEFQFWGSELYIRNIPLRTEGLDLYSIFSASEIAEFTRKTKQANAANEGDMVCIYVKKEKSLSERVTNSSKFATS